MDWRQIVSLLGVAIAIYSTAAYAKTIITGESKPHRITWGGWTLVASLGLISSIRGGAGVGLLVTGTFAISIGLVFILSCLPGHGKPGLSRWEVIAGAVAALILFTQPFVNYSPNVGQTIALAADLVFFWPTLREAWKHPEYEGLRPWVIGAVAESLGVAALGNYSYSAAAYSIYLLLGNIAVILTLIASRDHQRPWVRTEAPKSQFRRWIA